MLPHIIKYLTEADLARCLRVNAAFHAVAGQKLYRRLTIDKGPDGEKRTPLDDVPDGASLTKLRLLETTEIMRFRSFSDRSDDPNIEKDLSKVNTAWIENTDLDMLQSTVRILRRVQPRHLIFRGRFSEFSRIVHPTGLTSFNYCAYDLASLSADTPDCGPSLHRHTSVPIDQPSCKIIIRESELENHARRAHRMSPMRHLRNWGRKLSVILLPDNPSSVSCQISFPSVTDEYSFWTGKELYQHLVSQLAAAAVCANAGLTIVHAQCLDIPKDFLDPPMERDHSNELQDEQEVEESAERCLKWEENVRDESSKREGGVDGVQRLREHMSAFLEETRAKDEVWGPIHPDDLPEGWVQRAMDGVRFVSMADYLKEVKWWTVFEEEEIAPWLDQRDREAGKPTE